MTDPEKGLSLPQAHIITPEAETSCHYLFSAARNMYLEDELVDEKTCEVVDEWISKSR